MGLFDFFRNLAFFKGRNTEGLVEEDLDFAKWIKAHQDWRGRLIDYIGGTSAEALDEEVVCRDDRCALGHWIYDHGGRFYGDLPLFQELKSQHADFHASAGLVVTMFKKAGHKAAKKALHADFDLNSMRVVRSLTSLERQVKG
jgi:hypothetical protein